MGYSFLTKSAKLKLTKSTNQKTIRYSFLTKSAKLKPEVVPVVLDGGYSFLTKSAKLKLDFDYHVDDLRYSFLTKSAKLKHTGRTCIPETPNYDLTKKAETIDINRF